MRCYVSRWARHSFHDGRILYVDMLSVGDTFRPTDGACYREHVIRSIDRSDRLDRINQTLMKLMKHLCDDITV